MENRLPEKLALLRKYYGYSQGDVANTVGVPVTEYMKWENGSAICTIYQLQKLAELFKISLDALADNTKKIAVPEKDIKEDSVDIPFMDQVGKGDLTDTLANINEAIEQTRLFRTDAQPAQEDTFSDTRQVDTEGFQVTMVNEIVDDLQTDKYEIEDNTEEEEPKKKSSILLYLAAAAVIVLIAAVVIMLSDKNGTSVQISEKNRFAVGDTYSLYVENDGTLTVKGQFNPAQTFSDVVQVSAFGSHAVGLKSDGTVVSSASSEDLSSWEKVTMVAAGKLHTAVLMSDGTVACTGEEAACAVRDWKNIKAVYAGSGITIGIDEEGTVFTSPSTTPGNGEKGIKTAAAGNDQLILVRTDGTAVSYGLNGAEAVDVSAWQNISSVTCGSGIAAGVTSLHTIYAAGSEAYQSTCAAWADIRYADMNNSTLAAVDGSGRVFGIGENSGQYDQSSEQAEPSETEEPQTQLAAVQNITWNTTTANVAIYWDAVENADYYEVSVSTRPATRIPNIVTNSTSIPVNELTNGEEYTITITAYSDEEAYLPSEPASVQFVYNLVTIQLDTPSNVISEADEESWAVSWDAVNHADYYTVVLDGGESRTTNTFGITYDMKEFGYENETEHTIEITAHSYDEKYTSSETLSTTVIYSYAIRKYSVTLVFRCTDGSAIDSTSTTDMELEPGIYLLSDYVPDGYVLADPDEDEFEVASDLTMMVLVDPEYVPEPEPEESPSEEPEPEVTPYAEEETGDE